jgi:hypothetical protein
MPGEIVEVLAEKAVTSGQAVLGVIGRLKRNALLSDFPSQNAAVKERREVRASTTLSPQYTESMSE